MNTVVVDLNGIQAAPLPQDPPPLRASHPPKRIIISRAKEGLWLSTKSRLLRPCFKGMLAGGIRYLYLQDLHVKTLNAKV